MAHSMRMPSCSLISASRSNNAVFQSKFANSSSCQYRYFSQSSQRNMRGIPTNMKMKTPSQPSMKTRSRQLGKMDLPQDLGLLPGTFIKPLWRDMPSIFEQPQERLRMEWLWLKMGVQNFIGLLAYCKYLNKGLPTRLLERRKAARDFHQQMYTAFADGDVPALRKICCTGLANNLSARIASRAKDEKVTWNLDKYVYGASTFFTGVRVVSDRATQIPELPNSGIRQVVLRITSKQSTEKSKVPFKNAEDSTAVEPAKPKQQDCTEYIVLQKLRWTGEEQEWRIWGHATPTTVDDLQSPFFAAGLTLAERMEAMKQSVR